MMKSRPFRRVAAVVLVILLMGQAGGFALAVDQPSSWAQAEVDDARSKSLILIEADGNYQGYINRELFCMQIVNMVETVLGSSVTITIANPFTDVSNDYVTKAYQLGIVNGISATAFAPDNNITRQEIAAMMMRSARVLDQLGGKSYSDVSGYESLEFADQDEIAYWALADIQIANSLGIMNGVGSNRIDPTGNTTVEQSILLVNRLFDGFMAVPTTATENSAPEALDDPVAFTVSEQTALLIDASQLATDADGDTLEVIAVEGQTSVYTTAYGSAELTSAGKISYTSGDITENVSDDFTVTVSDGTDVTEINISVNVTYTFVWVTTPTIYSVSISGDAVMGETLSAYMITYIPVPETTPTLSYQWMRASSEDGTYTDISGATSSSYQITINDVGKYLMLEVTATGSAGGSATSSAKGPVTYGFAGGSGTSSDPYQIATAEQFMLLDVVPTTNTYFKLTDEIELGEDDYITATFNGRLYGNDSIVILDISGASSSYIGLFSKTGSSAYIHGIYLYGSIDATAHSCVAGFAGRNDGTITHCYSGVDITAIDYAGGIVGFNTGTVTKCYSSADIDARNSVGGIVGYNTGTVSKCAASSTASVTASGNKAGGVVGWNTASLNACCSHASVTGVSYIGGLIGYTENYISNCYSTGAVSGTSSVGGFCGYESASNWVGIYCYYDKDTSGQSDTGKGTPKSTSEMKTQSTYVYWDFTNTWGYIGGFYPYLRDLPSSGL